MAKKKISNLEEGEIDDDDDDEIFVVEQNVTKIVNSEIQEDGEIVDSLEEVDAVLEDVSYNYFIVFLRASFFFKYFTCNISNIPKNRINLN